MRRLITTFAPSPVIASYITDLNRAAGNFEPYKVALTDDEKLGARSMSQGREGYVRLVSTIATQFPNSLSRADDPIDLANLLDYYGDVRAIRAAFLQGLEMVEEIILATGIDLMAISDRYIDSLQISRKNESSLDLNMRDVDAYNRRFRNKPEDDLPDTPENPDL